MLGFYNYTVYLTYVGFLSGVAGIFLAAQGRTTGALLCLLLAGLCDMFDGKIARTKKDRTTDEKNFGIQIDSLNDIVCFGVLPALISYSSGCTKGWQMAIAALFTLCGMIRLAYFNVTEETRQKSTDANRKMYAGVPITTSATVVPLLACFTKLLGAAYPVCYTALLAVLGFLYIAPIQIRKPGRIGGIVLLVLGAVAFFILFLLK